MSTKHHTLLLAGAVLLSLSASASAQTKKLYCWN